MVTRDGESGGQGPILGDRPIERGWRAVTQPSRTELNGQLTIKNTFAVSLAKRQKDKWHFLELKTTCFSFKSEIFQS